MNLRSTGLGPMEKTEIPKGGAHVEPGEHLSASTLLTGESFWDEATFHEELERFYFRSWLNVGRSDQIPNPGDFFVREIGNESLLFIRGEDREIRGFYNVCRHRGTRIVGVAEGQKLGSLVCPYHAWTYSVEGKLVGAPHTEPLVDFRREDYGLHSFRTGTVSTATLSSRTCSSAFTRTISWSIDSGPEARLARPSNAIGTSTRT